MEMHIIVNTKMLYPFNQTFPPLKYIFVGLAAYTGKFLDGDLGDSLGLI